MSKLTAAYLAGLIDGEGYLGIQKRTKVECIGGKMYVGVLKIVMIDKYLIKWLKDSFGGYFGKRIGKDGRMDSYEWCLRHEKNIKPFLDKVFPYLKVKRKQAEVLRVFFRTFDNKKIGTRLTEETREYREKLYLELKLLKKSTQWQPERLSEVSPKG